MKSKAKDEDMDGEAALPEPHACDASPSTRQTIPGRFRSPMDPADMWGDAAGDRAVSKESDGFARQYSTSTTASNVSQTTLVSCESDDPHSFLQDSSLRSISEVDIQIDTGTSLSVKELYKVKPATYYKFGQPQSGVLGIGQFGKVVRAKCRKTGRRCALKLISTATRKEKDVFLNEMYILRRLNHPNVVRLHTVFQEESFYVLDMTLCTGGMLYSRLQAHNNKEDDGGGCFEVGTCALYMKQMFSAVAYLHYHYVCHRDLKTDNMMFASEAPDSPLKIIDFGLSTIFKDDEMMTDIVGTLCAMAPELVRREPYNEKIDIWALGVACYECCSGCSPYEVSDKGEVNFKATIASILEHNLKFPPEKWERFKNSGAEELIKASLEPDPKERQSAAVLLSDFKFLNSARAPTPMACCLIQ
mmetsp:Transcript_18804/g.39991  ORF Transcript_18804/g.39991 Transcript_18804/m.39991 type:complete len:417 (+) Transcript_18804:61-1311(+)